MTPIEIAHALRDARLDAIRKRETAITLRSGPAIALHIVPLLPMENIDMGETGNSANLAPLYVQNTSKYYNFDGAFAITPNLPIQEHNGYVQLFRDGSVECVDTFLLNPPELFTGGQRRIPSSTVEDEIVKATIRFLRVQQHVGVKPPLVVMLAMAGVKDFILGVDTKRSFDIARPIDRDELVFRDVFVTEYGCDVELALRPIFNQLWNAAGLSHCADYGQDGRLHR